MRTPQTDNTYAVWKRAESCLSITAKHTTPHQLDRIETRKKRPRTNRIKMLSPEGPSDMLELELQEIMTRWLATNHTPQGTVYVHIWELDMQSLVNKC